MKVKLQEVAKLLNMQFQEYPDRWELTKPAIRIVVSRKGERRGIGSRSHTTGYASKLNGKEFGYFGHVETLDTTEEIIREINEALVEQGLMVDQPSTVDSISPDDQSVDNVQPTDTTDQPVDQGSADVQSVDNVQPTTDDQSSIVVTPTNGAISYQQKAELAGGKMDKLDLALKFRNKNGKIILHEVTDQLVKGTGQAGSARVYPFRVDLVDMKKSTCTCGYYLAEKNQGDFSPEKLCTHQIAGLITADNGNVIVQPKEIKTRQPRQPRATKQSNAMQSQVNQHVSQAFREKLDRSIAKAVKINIVDPILDAIEEGLIPFLIGQPGTGKSRGIEDVVIALEFDGLETQEGTDSCTEVDIVGIDDGKGLYKPGVLARAFKRARDGQKIVIMIDELARLNQRAQDIFLPALTPMPPRAARLEGIVTDDWVYIIHSPMWGIEWAPVKNIKFVFGANPWGARFDNAFMDRIAPIKVNYDPNVLKHFDQPMQEGITELWQLARDGMVPLPLSYRGISKAKNPSDTRIFKWYLAKLEQLNMTAYNMVLDILIARGLWKLDPTQQAAATGGLTI